MLNRFIFNRLLLIKDNIFSIDKGKVRREIEKKKMTAASLKI